MKKTLSTTAHLKLLSKHIAELLYGLEARAAAEMDAGARLKSMDAMLRLKKAMLETRLLEEELRERLQQRRGQSTSGMRKAGLSPEALEEIGELLGLRKKNVQSALAAHAEQLGAEPDKVND